MAIMISIPAGVIANQETANDLASNLSNTITQTGESINQTLTQLDCSLSSGFSGFGFRPPNITIPVIYQVNLAEAVKHDRALIQANLAAVEHQDSLEAVHLVVDKQVQ